MADAPAFNIHSMDMGANGVGAVGLADESKTYVRFLLEPKHFPAESEKQGHQVWQDVIMVLVQHPGERDPIKREMLELDKRRWPRQWDAFDKGRSNDPDGTPISILFPGSPSTSQMLGSLGIHTIEQMANVNDSAIGNIPFGGDTRKKAQGYLDTVKKAEGFNKLEAVIDQEKARSRSLEAQMEDMKAKMAEMGARFDEAGKPMAQAPSSGALSPEALAQIMAVVAATNNPPKRGPGRPPKTEEN